MRWGACAKKLLKPRGAGRSPSSAGSPWMEGDAVSALTASAILPPGSSEKFDIFRPVREMLPQPLAATRLAAGGRNPEKWRSLRGGGMLWANRPGDRIPGPTHEQ